MPALHDKKEEGTLVEIGPRFTLLPIRLLDGCFRGETIFTNGQYVSPNQVTPASRPNL